jgi:GGDEF domain-containing protein
VTDTITNGVLHLRLPHITDPLSLATIYATHKQLAVALAEQAALGLANISMRIALSEQVVRDPLTGLFNRRYLEETLAREQHRAARQRHPIGIIFLDIDHFKHVNDTWGHAAGDIVLRAVSRLLLANVRA